MLFSQACHAMNRFPGAHVDFGDDYVDVWCPSTGKKITSCKKIGGVVVGANQKNDRGQLVGYYAHGQVDWDMSPLPKNARFMKHYSKDGDKSDHSQGGSGGLPERIAPAEEYSDRLAFATKLAEEHGYVPSIQECKEYGYEIKGDEKKGNAEVKFEEPKASTAPQA